MNAGMPSCQYIFIDFTPVLFLHLEPSSLLFSVLHLLISHQITDFFAPGVNKLTLRCNYGLNYMDAL